MMNYCARRAPPVYIYTYCFYFALHVLDNMNNKSTALSATTRHFELKLFFLFELKLIWDTGWISVTLGKLLSFRFLYTFQPE